LQCDGTRAKTRFRLSAERTSPFKSAWASVQPTTGSRGVRISGSNAGYTMFRGSAKGTGYPLHSPVSPLHFPSRASPCAITFQLESTIRGLVTSYYYQPLRHVNDSCHCLMNDNTAPRRLTRYWPHDLLLPATGNNKQPKQTSLGAFSLRFNTISPLLLITPGKVDCKRQ
jgi:hypothetical protein